MKSTLSFLWCDLCTETSAETHFFIWEFISEDCCWKTLVFSVKSRFGETEDKELPLQRKKEGRKKTILDILEYSLDWINSEAVLSFIVHLEIWRKMAGIQWLMAFCLLLQGCLCSTEQTRSGCKTWSPQDKDHVNVCCDECHPGK